MTNKIVIFISGLVALILLPPIKAAYDDLVTTMLTPLGLSDFTMAFFILVPYGLLGVIIFGTIYKLFKRGGSGGGEF